MKNPARPQPFPPSPSPRLALAAVLFATVGLLWNCGAPKQPPASSPGEAGQGKAEHRIASFDQAGSQGEKIVLVQEFYQDMPVLGRTYQSALSLVPGVNDSSLGLHVAGDRDFNTESYAAVDESPFLEAASNPLSTFSIDVDRASYSNVRRFIQEGRRPPVDAVRIEELINYFPYDDPGPTGGDPLAIRTEVAEAPWNPKHRLLRIGLQARRMDLGDLPPNNLVFLIDVSGSMQTPDKLPLLKSAFRLLVNELRDQDRVAIVVYAGRAGLVLPSTPGSRKQEILGAIERLEAGGSTAGGQGLLLAYQVARENRITGGNNRVILATDGDFNVGVSSDAEMFRLVEEKRGQGTFLTVLGFGRGNLKDSRMEGMADRGNGQYAYVDSLLEARKVLVKELGGTLATIAKDVKLQVEFNPARVAAYRLIGYENRLLRKEDFEDDAKDAGEMGSGHAVTALYEIVPTGVEPDVEIRRTGPLRYQANAGSSGSDTPRRPQSAATAAGDELAFVNIRYKAPDGDTSRLMNHPVVDLPGRPSADFGFAASIAEFGMLLRGSKHAGQASLDEVIALARGSLGRDEEGYRQDFIRLAEAARPLLQKPVEVASIERE